MTINISVPETIADRTPRISVIGVGGGGGNAVNNMIASQLNGVEFVVANTDAQALAQSQAHCKIQLGAGTTKGLGAGSKPEIGRAAAEEVAEELKDSFDGSEMVFIAAGMGGGTGTGAAPIIARLAREQGILTVAVATKPFQFEGLHRMRIAEAGIEELEEYVDTLIVIPNQNLFRIATEKTTFSEAFRIADDVLYSGVRNVTDLMMVPGLINLDFEDVRTVMFQMGKAVMGTGEAEGQDRDIAAAEMALSNPLLDDVSMEGARGVLINITGGTDLTLFEIDKAANRIAEEVDPESNTIFGSTLDPSLDGRIRVSIVATGMDSKSRTQANRPEQEFPVKPPAHTAAAALPEKEPRAARAAFIQAEAEPEQYEQTALPPEAPELDLERARPAAFRDVTQSPAGPGVSADSPVPPGTGPLSPAWQPSPEPRKPFSIGERKAFIPPMPSEPRASLSADDRPTGSRPEAGGDDGGVSRGRRPGFFDRVKSGVRRESRPEAASTETAAPEAPSVKAPSDASAAPVRPLTGVGSEDRIVQSRTDNDHDLLQIPSFLRRQAN